MQAKCTFKRITALILSVLMTLLCLPMSALAEEPEIPMEDIIIEVITDDNEADSCISMISASDFSGKLSERFFLTIFFR